MRARSWLDLNNDAVGVLGRALSIRERVIEVVMAGRVGEQCQVALKWFPLSCDEDFIQRAMGQVFCSYVDIC